MKAKKIDVKDEMVHVKEMEVQIRAGERSCFFHAVNLFVLFCAVQSLLVFLVCLHGLFAGGEVM